MDPSPLFPASLISAEAVSALPGFTIRPLDKGDYARGFLECLRDLAPMGNLTADEFDERYDELDTQGRGPYYYVVVEHHGRIVATGAVVVEKKFIENRAVVGHVEEVCVAKDFQGRGMGRAVLGALDSVARNVGCTKSILICGPANEAFYAKCEYKSTSGIEMQHQHRYAPQD